MNYYFICYQYKLNGPKFHNIAVATESGSFPTQEEFEKVIREEFGKAVDQIEIISHAQISKYLFHEFNGVEIP